MPPFPSQQSVSSCRAGFRIQSQVSSFVHQHLLLVLGSVKCISDGGVEVGDNVPVKIQNPARGQDCPGCVVMMLVEVMSLVLVMVVVLTSCGKNPC